MKCNLAVTHIYNAYQLYQTVYGRPVQYKQNEARGLMHALACHGGVKKLSILELCAGRSEHQQHVRDLCEKRLAHEGFELMEYLTIDRVAGEDGNSAALIGDVLDMSGLGITGVNVVTAFFYSVSSITDDHGSHSILDQLMRSAYDVLPTGGVFYVDYVLNGSYSALGDVKADDHEETFEVAFDDELRSLYQIHPKADCTVEVKMRSQYDRLTGVNSDQFLTPFKINVDGKTVGRVTVEQPMTQRYFNEIEIIEAAKRAGFSDVLFFNHAHEEGTFVQLERDVILEDEDQDEAELLSTNMLFIK